MDTSNSYTAMTRQKIAIVMAALLLALPARSQDHERQDSIRAVVVSDERSFVRETGTVRLDRADLITTPVLLGTPDVLRVISTLPGVSSGMELFSGMYVHGGDGSDNLYLLEGMPLYQIGHMGGLFSAFNTDVVSSLDFYRSGFPARFGGRLSSVVDVRAEKGDSTSHHGSYSIGLIDGRFHIGGPVVRGKLTYDIALRRTWIDAIAVPVLAIMNIENPNKTTVGYSMTDFNASLCYAPSFKDRLTLHFYAGGDALNYGESSAKKLYTDKEIVKVEDATRLGVDWGNLTGGAAWSRRVSDRMEFNTGLYYTRGYSDYAYELVSHDADEDTVTVSRMHEDNSASVATAGAFFRLNARTGRHALETGIEYRHHSYLMIRNFAPVARRRYESDEASVYAEDVVELGPASFRAGLRCDFTSTEGVSFILPQPRLGANVRLSEGLVLKASFTSMTQSQHLLCPVLADIPTNTWAPSVGPLVPERSYQYAAGIYWKPASVQGLHFDAGLFYKSMEGCILYTGTTTVFPPVEDWEHSFSQGRGKSKGFELECGYTCGMAEASLYYTLSKTERYFPELYPDWFQDRFDNRHKITLTGSIRLTDKIVLNAMWNYHSGNRISIPTHYSVDAEGKATLMSPGPYNYQLPAYHRLDVGCDFHGHTRKGRKTVFNISVCNFYNRKNPVMALTTFTESGEPELKAWSLIPFLPSFSYRIEF